MKKGRSSRESQCEEKFKHGVDLIHNGRLVDAREVFEECLNSDPVSQWVLRNISGILCDYYEDYEYALSIVDLALGLDQGDVLAMVYKGIILRHLGRLDDAIDMYDEALTCEPGNVLAMMRKGALLTDDLARHEDALRIFNEVAILDPGNDECWWNMAQAYIGLDSLTSAIECLDRILSIAPERIDALELKLKLEVGLLLPTEAIKSAYKMIEIDPKNLWASYVIQVFEGLKNRTELFSVVFALVSTFRPTEEVFDELQNCQRIGGIALADYCESLAREALAEPGIPVRMLEDASRRMDEVEFRHWLLEGGAEVLANLLMALLVSRMLDYADEPQMRSPPSFSEDEEYSLNYVDTREQVSEDQPIQERALVKSGSGEGIDREEAHALFERGADLLHNDEALEAIQCFESALVYFEKENDLNRMLFSRLNLAWAFISLHEYDSGLIQCRYGEQLLEGNVPLHSKGLLYSYMASCLLGAERAEEALSVSKRAIRIFCSMDENELLLDREINQLMNLSLHLGDLCSRIYAYCINIVYLTISEVPAEVMMRVLKAADSAEDETSLSRLLSDECDDEIVKALEAILSEAQDAEDHLVSEYIKKTMFYMAQEKVAADESERQVQYTDLVDTSGGSRRTPRADELAIRSITDVEKALSAGDLEVAKEIADRIVMTQDSLDLLGKAAAAEITGRVGWELILAGNLGSGVEHLERAFDFSRSAGDVERIFNSLDCLGYAYIQLRRPRAAINKYYRLVSLASDIDDTARVKKYLPNVLTAFAHSISNDNDTYKFDEEIAPDDMKYMLEDALYMFEEVAPLYSDAEWQEVLKPMILNFMSVIRDLLPASAHSEFTKVLLNNWREKYVLDNVAFAVIDKVEGGMGEILYASELEEPFRLVIIKKLKKQIAGDSRARDRIVREAHIWMEMPDHPNIVQIYFVSESHDQVHIVCELVMAPGYSGITLRSLIDEGDLSFDRACRIALDICSGMDHAYRFYKEQDKEFVHLDLKPENILIDEGGIAKIADFGIAALSRTEDSVSTKGTIRKDRVLGTLPYMSPEQFEGERPCDIRNDMYSFGCLFYEMTTGSPLFVALDPVAYRSLHVNAQPDFSAITKAEYPKALVRILTKCCQKERNKRYRNFALLKKDIQMMIGEPEVYIRDVVGENAYNHKLMLANSYIETKDLQKALGLYDEILLEDPNNVDALYGKALYMKMSRLYEDARVLIDQILEIDSSHVLAQEMKGALLAIEGELIPALNLLSSIIKENPHQVTALCKKGGVLLQLSWYEDAHTCFERAIEISTEDPIARLGRLQALIGLRRIDETREDFEWLSEFSRRSPTIRRYFFDYQDSLVDRLRELSREVLSLTGEKNIKLDPELIAQAEKWARLADE